MNMKKIVSAASALTIAASAFASMGIVANAAENTESATFVQQKTWSADNKAGTTDVSTSKAHAGVGPSSNSSNYPAIAAIQFSIKNENKLDIKSATLSFNVAVSGSDRTLSVYTASNASYDFAEVPIFSADGVTGIYTQTETGTKWTYSGILGDLTSVKDFGKTLAGTTEQTVDVTSYVESAGNYATFAFSNANAGADITNAALTIEYIPAGASTYKATFTEKNGVAATVTVDGDAVTADTTFLAGDYTFTATAPGYEDYTGTFTVTDKDVNVEYEMTAKTPAEKITVNYVNGEALIDTTEISVSGKYVGDSQYIYVPSYFEKNGTLYDVRAGLGETKAGTGKTSPYVKDHSKNIALTDVNTVVTVESKPVDCLSYQYVDYDDVATDGSIGRMWMYSNGKFKPLGTGDETVVLTVAESGTYDVEVNVGMTYLSNTPDPAITVLAAGNELGTANLYNSAATVTGKDIKLKAGDTITVKSTKTNAAVDYVYLKKTAAEEVPVVDPTATRKQLYSGTTDTNNPTRDTGSAWLVTVTPGSTAINTLGVSIDGAQGDKTIETSIFGGGEAVFAVAVNKTAENITLFNVLADTVTVEATVIE